MQTIKQNVHQHSHPSLQLMINIEIINYMQEASYHMNLELEPIVSHTDMAMAGSLNV
jgi:hypothetical protein